MTFQISLETAEAYESDFVPNFFAEWAGYLVDFADIQPGQRVLDVACGTGIVARTVPETSTVAGVDLNEAMLTVARRVAPHLDWHQGDAGNLPFPDGSYDAVLCQMALMFFPDKVRALAEMGRVAGSGTVAVQVVGRLAESPGYAPFAEAVAKHAGQESVDLWAAYFNLGDPAELRELFAAAGLEVLRFESRHGRGRFGSIDAFVAAEVGATPMASQVDADTLEAIRVDVNEALKGFQSPDGGVALPIEGHLLLARQV